MNENIEKYGTDDKEYLSEYKVAESILEQYKDHKIETIHDVNHIVADLMIEHGPDGHCDGSEIISLILWRLLKK